MTWKTISALVLAGCGAPTCFQFYNESTAISNADVQRIQQAMPEYWADLAPVWGLPSAANFNCPGGVPVSFIDTVPVPQSSAYHEWIGGEAVIVVEMPQFADAGLFVPNPIFKQTVSSAVSHEIAETAVDPFADGREICDPIENLVFPLPSGIYVSDFVLPGWFTDAGGQEDFMGKVQ